MWRRMNEKKKKTKAVSDRHRNQSLDPYEKFSKFCMEFLICFVAL